MSSSHHIHSSYLLADLKNVAARLGKPPTIREYTELGAYGSTTISQRFGSWNNALREAGLEVNVRRGIDDEELLEAIEDVADELGRTPTRDEFVDHSDYSVGVVRYRFGSWREGVREAGLEPRDRGRGSQLVDKLDKLPADAVGGGE